MYKVMELHDLQQIAMKEYKGYTFWEITIYYEMTDQGEMVYEISEPYSNYIDRKGFIQRSPEYGKDVRRFLTKDEAKNYKTIQFYKLYLNIENLMNEHDIKNRFKSLQKKYPEQFL